MLQFVNQNLYLSNKEIIRVNTSITQFIESCEQIMLKEGDKLFAHANRQDYIYCLLLGRAKIMR